MISFSSPARRAPRISFAPSAAKSLAAAAPMPLLAPGTMIVFPLRSMPIPSKRMSESPNHATPCDRPVSCANVLRRGRKAAIRTGCSAGTFGFGADPASRSASASSASRKATRMMMFRFDGVWLTGQNLCPGLRAKPALTVFRRRTDEAARQPRGGLPRPCGAHSRCRVA